ncbi:MAG: hypothetical protein NC305_13870 [Lachnospiraceae bacterium]|nr:hypothetical protein [Butyrivibrio sp.]MCM1342978.1 hypothetical protein [Muribaculaceae bacterium]MCM1411620.1 hypothetical protein [Lachnospiraceae bacterium]
MDSYKKSYVAFLDILGFKEMINTNAFDGYYDAKLRQKYRWLSDKYYRVVYKIQYGRIGIGEI